MISTRPSVLPEPVRAFASPDGVVVELAQEGVRVVERRGALGREHVLDGPLRAFVFLANRGRALTVEGFVEVVPEGPPTPVSIASWAELESYASRLDATRSLPRQEHMIASSITPALARTDSRFAEALATLLLLDWPSTLDVAATIDALDDPEPALFAVLARELSASRHYPKELVRVATSYASPRVADLALGALSRTTDPDAWMDVLIEGEPALRARDAPRLAVLAKKAPSREVATMCRDIARDLGGTPKPRRR
ncbi:MAG: hypothetical protein OHK0013_41180 [Sandaracinaceae bacterium]